MSESLLHLCIAIEILAFLVFTGNLSNKAIWYCDVCDFTYLASS